MARVERDRLRMMMLIRRFEERTFQEYTKPGQKIGGFCHLYSGQEAIAVGTAALFDKKRDYLINGYRCHGHSLALGMSPHAAMAELFGKATGCSKGKGGSMHLFDASVGNNGGHGIVGGQLPLGAGMAFAQWYKKTGGVTFTFMGDGAINQGTHNEALNLASLWKLPVIWVIENNGVAMGTQVARHSAEKDLAKRGSGYNMPYFNVDGNDLDTVIQAFGEAVDRARSGGGPYLFLRKHLSLPRPFDVGCDEISHEGRDGEGQGARPDRAVRSPTARERVAHRRAYRSAGRRGQRADRKRHRASRQRSAPAIGRSLQ